MSEFKTFDDLEFKPRNGPFANNGVQAIMEFPNGHRISVVGGAHTYGDGVTSFEIWRSCDSDVKGYLTKEEVTEEMIDLQKTTLPKNEFGF